MPTERTLLTTTSTLITAPQPLVTPNARLTSKHHHITTCSSGREESSQYLPVCTIRVPDR
jgi:hypothetical protein